MSPQLVKALALGTLWVLLPAGVSAQVGKPRDFINNPHPMMPWSGITYPGRVDYGKAVRYFRVPPRHVVVETPVPTPEGLPHQTQQQVVEIPGYYIVETTTGFYYPERWTLERLNIGVYGWRQLAPTFVRK